MNTDDMFERWAGEEKVAEIADRIRDDLDSLSSIARERAGVTHTEQVPISDEESPFGPDSEPPPVTKSGGFGDVKLKGGKQKFNARKHYPRAKEMLTELWPGSMVFTVDGFKAGYGGTLVSTDLLGFIDIAGITANGAWIACNVTTTASMQAHLRDYTSPTNTHGQAKTPVVDLLENYLRNRGVFYIFGFEKVGRFWEHKVLKVTQELLDETKARKRK